MNKSAILLSISFEAKLAGLQYQHACVALVLQVNRHAKHNKGQRADDVDSYLALFEHKRQPNGKLLAPEVAAISAFLVMTVKEFALFQHADTVLKVSYSPMLCRHIPDSLWLQQASSSRCLIFFQTKQRWPALRRAVH